MLDPKADWRQFKNPVGHLNKIFNYGVGSIARMVNEGKIPAFKENKNYLIVCLELLLLKNLRRK